MAANKRHAPNPFQDLLRALADRSDRPKPWVDPMDWPWSDEQFSHRFVRRVNYQALGSADTADEIEDIIALLEPKSRARMLDLCSGGGRHAIALALRGFKMTGIDVGPGAVALARETARNLGLSIDFRQVDLRNVSFEDAFDAAYIVCGGLSGWSPSDAQTVLNVTHRALVPGGKFLGEFEDAGMLGQADSRQWEFVDADAAVFVDAPHLKLTERLVDWDLAAAVQRTTVVAADGEVRQFLRCHQFYTEDSIKGLLEAARFQVLTFAPGGEPGSRKVLAVKT